MPNYHITCRYDPLQQLLLDSRSLNGTAATILDNANSDSISIRPLHGLEGRSLPAAACYDKDVTNGFRSIHNLCLKTTAIGRC